MKRYFWQFILLVTSTVMLVQCSDEKFPGFNKSPDGVYYKFHYRSNNTSNPHDSDWFKIKLDYRLEDTLLYSSAHENKDLILPNLPSIFKGDLYDGLKLMSDGDSMSIAVVADSFF